MLDVMIYFINHHYTTDILQQPSQHGIHNAVSRLDQVQMFCINTKHGHEDHLGFLMTFLAQSQAEIVTERVFLRNPVFKEIYKR